MPTLITNQTTMDTWNGHAPALDADGILRNLCWSPRYVTKTASYTVLARETGTWFLTTGATAAVTFTLPAISDGPYIFHFVAVADVGMVVASAAADTLLTFNDAAADSVAFSTASEIMGSLVIAGCDGTTVFAITPIVSDLQTVTVATA